jgi:benzoate/toluate 1,2-dioxygenase reductase subunit
MIWPAGLEGRDGMTSYRIALNFEDGVTRFIDCKAGEKVLDAAFRSRINLPMDCSDGVCGTCKCYAESGSYDLGDDYIEDALTGDEAASGFVLTCQMRPTSDCAIAVPITSTACKTAHQRFEATVAAITPYGEAAVGLELEIDAGTAAPLFLPGQYVTIDVPGSGLTRAYSFMTAPGERRIGFLIKKIPGGVMGTWLTRAKPGDRLSLNGPLGSFYLRSGDAPLLFLAGGTGLAPFLSMLEVLAGEGSRRRVRLVYGVTRGEDLVLVEALDAFKSRLSGFEFTTVVADAASSHPRKGWVTQHLPEDLATDSRTEVYLCGPPPMVEAVRDHFEATGITPARFTFEKFTPNAPLRQSA